MARRQNENLADSRSLKFYLTGGGNVVTGRGRLVGGAGEA
jgi:hypothetical protein